MRIHTKLDYIWSGTEYVLIHSEGFDCPENGLALCKGASSSENAINQQQQAFQTTLQNDYGQQFANQSNILSSLNNSLAPTVAAGPNQFGYSTGQTNSLNSTAIQGAASANKQAQQQVQNQQAIAGGGNEFLPSGVNAQVNASVASNSANNLSNNLLNIQNAGYQQGNQNYNNAIAGMGGVAGQYNPLGYASGTTGAGSAAFGGASTIQQQNAAASPWGAIGGLVGGLGGAFLGPLGSSIGSKLGSSLGGMVNGSSGSGQLTASQSGMGG